MTMRGGTDIQSVSITNDPSSFLSLVNQDEVVALSPQDRTWTLWVSALEPKVVGL
jgi:hypothetical protein